MEIADIIELAERYRSLGNAVQDQLKAFLDDDSGNYYMKTLPDVREFLAFARERGVEGVDWAIESIDSRLTGRARDAEEHHDA